MQLERSYITLAGSSKAVKRSRRHTFVIFSSLIRRKRSIRRKKTDFQICTLMPTRDAFCHLLHSSWNGPSCYLQVATVDQHGKFPLHQEPSWSYFSRKQRGNEEPSTSHQAGSITNWNPFFFSNTQESCVSLY